MTTMMPTLNQFVFWLFTVLCSGIAAYMGSYLRKKAENAAIHEDIAKLVEQQRAMAEATKRIEAQISNEVWDRQKQWELTRDGAVKVMEAYGRLEIASAEVNRVSGRLLDYRATHEAVEQWIIAQHSMIDAVKFLNFVCWTNETSYALADYLMELDSIKAPSREEHTFIYKIAGNTPSLTDKFIRLRGALRKELRLQAKESAFLIPTPQSSGSSEVQGPAPPNPE